MDEGRKGKIGILLGNIHSCVREADLAVPSCYHHENFSSHHENIPVVSSSSPGPAHWGTFDMSARLLGELTFRAAG